ncbi:hypothetical protein HK098_001003 [Nowakowskiella sp. JEL0407]|nr:hypothetical protein HK098_001003 [Nowakowskiella sp. JEL0407]
MPKLPIEILLQIFITSANESSPDHFYNLCLVHPSLTPALKTNTLYGKFGPNTYRLDRLFYPTHKHWITTNPHHAEQVILSMLQHTKPFWQKKISHEISSGYNEMRIDMFNKPVFCEPPPKDLYEYQAKHWIRASGCAHRLLRKCIKFNMYHAVRFLVSELGASVSQRHMWSLNTKDLGRYNCLYAVFNTQVGVDKKMLRMFVKEFGADADCYDGYTTLIEDYITELDEGVELDEEVLCLLVDGGANLAEALRDQVYADLGTTTDLMIRWTQENNFAELEALIRRKFS